MTHIMTCRNLPEELSGAIEAGKAPEFSVLFYVCNNRQTGDAQEIRVSLSLTLAGEKVSVKVRQKKKLSAVDNGDGKDYQVFNGRLGSFDLVEKAFQKALRKRWPDMPGLDKRRITNYAVHAIGEQNSHVVQVIIRVSNGQGVDYSVKRIGVDTVAQTVEALALVYHWVAWRGLRRERGEKKKK